MNQEVRVRFAPSPTGALHIGGVRTALYNYLFAKKHQGTFIIRIEDTDQTRYKPWAEKYILDSLEWLGLKADESPVVGGDYGPYRQSERKEIYMQYALQLVESGHAYYAFDTSDDLEAMRKRLEEAKAKNTSYNAITRRQMTNSLTLSPAEVQKRIKSGEPYVIRVKIPPKEEIRYQDLVLDWVKAHSSTLDDKVLIKSDGMPTYHLANVVDDYLMKITHVIRGKEWVPSTYLHVLLYQYLGWEASRPKFAHLPLLLKPGGGGKLSKRDGIKFGFPVFPLAWKDLDEKTHQEIDILGFQNEGYLPEALLNFLAFLGWNPGGEEEFFSLEELTKAFSIDRVGKSDAIFDIDKAKWFNQQYVKAKSDTELAGILLDDPRAQASKLSLEKAEKIASLMRERISFPGDIFKDAAYFFNAPEKYDEKTIRKKWNEESAGFLASYKDALVKHPGTWKAEAIKEILNQLIESQGIKMGKVMPAIRVALTGLGGGPDLSSTIEIVGKEESLRRMNLALEKFGNGATN